jgi:hypothetical protein
MQIRVSRKEKHRMDKPTHHCYYGTIKIREGSSAKRVRCYVYHRLCHGMIDHAQGHRRRESSTYPLLS